MKIIRKHWKAILTVIALLIVIFFLVPEKQACPDTNITELIIKERILFHSITLGSCGGIDFDPNTGEIELWDRAGRISLRDVIALGAVE